MEKERHQNVLAWDVKLSNSISDGDGGTGGALTSVQ